MLTYLDAVDFLTNNRRLALDTCRELVLGDADDEVSGLDVPRDCECDTEFLDILLPFIGKGSLLGGFFGTRCRFFGGSWFWRILISSALAMPGTCVAVSRVGREINENLTRTFVVGHFWSWAEAILWTTQLVVL